MGRARPKRSAYPESVELELDLGRRDDAGTVDAILGSVLGLLALINAAAVFLLPKALGYPSGGSFLLTALPAFGVGATVLAIAIGAFGIIRRHRVWAPVLVSLGFLAIAVANALLWVAAVASV